jgi:hypothetical protein
VGSSSLGSYLDFPLKGIFLFLDTTTALGSKACYSVLQLAMVVDRVRANVSSTQLLSASFQVHLLHLFAISSIFPCIPLRYKHARISRIFVRRLKGVSYLASKPHCDFIDALTSPICIPVSAYKAIIEALCWSHCKALLNSHSGSPGPHEIAPADLVTFISTVETRYCPRTNVLACCNYLG